MFSALASRCCWRGSAAAAAAAGYGRLNIDNACNDAATGGEGDYQGKCEKEIADKWPPLGISLG
jgi:hypothetical protein